MKVSGYYRKAEEYGKANIKTTSILYYKRENY